MQEFLNSLYKGISTINSYLSGYILIVLLIGVGIFFSVVTRFVQVRCFGEGMKNVFGKMTLNGKKHKSGMSSFQAFTTAVAAQVGTGNIVGASGAILAGGPGAIFWMWIIAFLGMATNYAEAVLAIKTRVVNKDGSISGGPIYYIKTAFKNNFGKFLAVFFAVSTIISLGFIGLMVQSNAISSSISGLFTQDSSNLVPNIIVGVVMVLVAGFIFIGGMQRLASTTEKIVPIMAIIYLLGGFIIICRQIVVLPEAFGLIFKYAFTPDAIIGGAIGSALAKAVQMGAKRGLFSNEAGMGSTPHAHAQANVEHPHDQGTAAMIGVFIDTFIVLTMTALIVITTLYAGNGSITQISQQAIKDGTSVSEAIANAGYNSNNLVAMGIASLFNGATAGAILGKVFVAVCLTFFAFSTIISWNMFGKINFQYLFGKKSTIIYSILCLCFIMLGALLQNDLVWELMDFFNYLMVIPNVIALVALYKLVKNEVDDASKRKKLHTLKDQEQQAGATK